MMMTRQFVCRERERERQGESREEMGLFRGEWVGLKMYNGATLWGSTAVMPLS